MREIKFRFTFKDGNFFAKRYMTLDELLDSNFALEQMEESINSEVNIFDIEDYPDYEVFKDEYTGLKDKNLVEIYEGDIVVVTEIDEDSCMGRELSYKGVVSYANSLNLTHYVSQYPTSFCLISKYFYREQSLLFNDRWDYEVIGNIYENQDLLKG